MKKKLFTSKIKTLLIVAVALAIVTTVVVAVSGGTTAGENLVGTILSPIRSGVAAIDRQALRIYNYIFSYESLAAENAELKRQILDMQEDVRTAQQLQREKEDLLNSRRVMLVQDKLGDLCVATGEYTQARQWYALGLAASESWYAKLPNLRTLNDLCRCQLSMAWAAEYLKDYH